MGTPVGASAQNVTRDKEVRRLMSPILRPKSNLVPMAPGLEQWNSSAALFLPFAVKDPSPFAKNAPFPESRDWAYATLMQWVLSLNLRRLNDIAGQFAKGDYPNATYHLALGLALSAEPEDPIFGLLQNQYGIDVVLVQEMSCIPGIDLMSRPYTAADVAPEELARCMRLVEADRVVPIPGFERAPSDAKLPRMPLRVCPQMMILSTKILSRKLNKSLNLSFSLSGVQCHRYLRSGSVRPQIVPRRDLP